MSRLVTKPTYWHVRPAKTQISLDIRPVWSVSSLCAQWVAKDPSFFHADSEDSDQTGRMPRLIWIFTGRTCHFVGFVTWRLKWSWIRDNCRYIFIILEMFALLNTRDHLKKSFLWGSWKYERNGSRARDPFCSYFHELQKKWNSSLIFTLCFYIVFVHYLWNFGLNLANKRRRKVIIRRVWLLRSTAVTMTWRQSNVTSASQLLHLSMTSLTRNVAWTSVVYGCMNLVVPK